MEIKGDYYFNSFHPEVKGKDEELVKRNPSNIDEVLWRSTVSYENIEKIIVSARTGFANWRSIKLEERIGYLKKYGEALKSKKKLLQEAISKETGKPLWEAETEVNAVIGKINVTIEESLPLIQNQQYSELMPKTDARLIYKPLGVSLIIGPFNFPCHLANGQIVSSLLAGNSIIFKPSEKTIFSGQLLIDCLDEIGLPKGVVNFSVGAGETAQRLVKDKRVNAIYFTGSKQVGLKILQSTISNLGKLVALELGGKNTTIIHKDAEIDFAVEELIKSAFLTAGQRCTSTSNVAIHCSIKDEFISKFHNRAKELVIANPFEFEKEPFMGPLIDDNAVQNYLKFMGMAKREGLEQVMRGKQLDRNTKGHYVSPSIHYLEKYENDGHFIKSELFGPNCVFIPYEEIEEAISISNLSEYGLSGAIFSKSYELFEKCANEIDVGIFNFNRSTVGASSKLPFGGVKSSGNYRPAGVSMIQSCVYPQSCLVVS